MIDYDRFTHIFLDNFLNGAQFKRNDPSLPLPDAVVCMRVAKHLKTHYPDFFVNWKMKHVIKLLRISIHEYGTHEGSIDIDEFEKVFKSNIKDIVIRKFTPEEKFVYVFKALTKTQNSDIIRASETPYDRKSSFLIERVLQKIGFTIDAYNALCETICHEDVKECSINTIVNLIR